MTDRAEEIERIAGEVVRRWNREGNPHLSTGAIGVARLAAEIALSAYREGQQAHDDVGEASFMDRGTSAALAAYREDRGGAEEAEPVGWLHTMHMELGQTAERVTLGRPHGWGKAGRDYDPSFTITSQPLYLAPPPQPTQERGWRPDPEAVERITRFANGAYLVDLYPSNTGALDGFRADVRALLPPVENGEDAK